MASSFFDSAIYELNSSTGAVIKTLVAPNSQATLQGPSGMTVGPDGNLYLSSQFTSSIVEYNVASNTLSTFIDSSVLGPVATANGDTQFAPAGLSFGPDGNLYVSLNGGQASTSGGAVVRFGITSSGGTLSYSGTSTTIATGLVQPTEMTFGGGAATGNTLYVSNSGGGLVAGSVVAISHADGAAPTSKTFIASGSGSLNYPAGLAWQGGKLYVVDLAATDSHQGQILRFNANGSFDEVFTKPANSLLRQFPAGMVFTPDGHLLTANLGATYPVAFGGPGTDGSIYQFTSNGTFSQDLSSSAFPAQMVTVGGQSSPVTNFSPSQLVLNAGNHAPTVSAGNPYAINEGGTLTLHASGHDADGDTLTYSWDINGDGTYGDVTGASPTLTWARLTALGVTSGSNFSVSVMASDGHGQVVTSAAISVTIIQVPLKASISGPATINETASYLLHLSSTTLAGKAIQQWDINWGDGTPDTVVAGTTKSVAHIYANGPNDYTISATATDPTSTVASNTLNVQVNHVRPRLTISGPAATTEQATYTLNLSGTEKGSHTIAFWTINWGDGTQPQIVNGDPASVTHVFASGPKHYAISATATDDVGTYSAGPRVAVFVRHAPPILAISGSSSIAEGTQYTLQLSGSELGNHTIKSWIINWGDGSAPQTLAGERTSASHVFFARSHGTFTITARAIDDVGTYAAPSGVAVAVEHVPPSLNIIGSSAATAKQPYTLFLSGIEPVQGHTIARWTITWGDGTTTIVRGNPSSVRHTYASKGSFTVSAAATDDVGTYPASSTINVTVA
jgi:hypothetical protein